MVLLLGRFVAAAHTGRCRMCKIWDIVLGGILIMAAFTQIVEQASDILWNYLLLFLLVGTGIFFTIKLHFVQLSSFADGVRHLFKGFSLHGKAADKDGMSSFQALATAIAAQVGTGNITGCATALVSGGPGALFWTWVSAFFGMATIYAEAVLAQTYRTTVDGQVTGGPAYYIRAAFKGKFGKFLAIFFSVALILALGFMGNMVQSNSIGDAFHNAFGVNRVVVGVVIAVLAAFIFLGGVKRIAAVTEKLVPIMALFYIIGCVIILVMNASAIPNGSCGGKSAWCSPRFWSTPAFTSVHQRLPCNISAILAAGNSFISSAVTVEIALTISRLFCVP